jgi:hypothetical protein
MVKMSTFYVVLVSAKIGAREGADQLGLNVTHEVTYTRHKSATGTAV